MITISNDPITGLKRKVDYDFYWIKSRRIINIKCIITNYDEEDNVIETTRISSYNKNLIASDDKVNSQTGIKLTNEQISNGNPWIYEYDFYVNVIGSAPVDVPALIESVIQARDLEGKFDI